MSNQTKVLLVGAGYMGAEYSKVLLAQGVSILAVGKSAESCKSLKEKTGVEAMPGGVEQYIKNNEFVPETAIVAVNIDSLAYTANLLLEKGSKKILLEKPGGMNREELEKVAQNAEKYNAQVFLAYNRRFYAATRKAMDIIKEDGGVSSFNFEFTEWGSKIAQLKQPETVKDIWLLANSSHVIDLAFFLGGYPVEISSFVAGGLFWHKNGSIYAGAGISSSGALFSYQANWEAPGRWGVEILTNKRRLIFRPMEKLQIQKLDSLKIDFCNIEDQLDIAFKPGIFLQVEAFLKEEIDPDLLDIWSYMKHFDVYEKIGGIV